MLRVPPPLLALLAGVAQRLLTPGAPAPTKMRGAAAAALALTSVGISGSTARRFKQGGTTVDPVHPERASTLVTNGPNSVTRNPMYVGLAGLLLANAVRRGSWLALAPLAGFVAVIDRLQVAPEERALRAKFGAAYDEYSTAVPRWIDRSSFARLRR
jgi:protein-S-isoprenylcysteine O-methyltransferase Ste14